MKNILRWLLGGLVVFSLTACDFGGGAGMDDDNDTVTEQDDDD